ncbi:MAG TPA: hypothetical protein VF167_12195 [Longimicrobiaceae bacterium]
MLTAILTLLAIGLVGVVALWMIFTVLGFVFSLVFGGIAFLLFKVLPLLVVGWLVLKLVGRSRCHHHRLSASDQKWLDGE